MNARRAAALLLLSLVAFAPAFAARAAEPDPTPGEHLGGYVGRASALAFSFQPVFPALLPTGDAPFEATIALSTADLKSGGNSYGHSSLLWPGSAASDPGPLIAQGAGQPTIGALVPKWGLQAEARQGQGVVTTGAPPAIVMRATGNADQADGDTRLADLDIPGLAHIEHVASTANSTVTDTSLTSTSRVALHGVSLLRGHITVDQIRSISKTTSDGTKSTSTGDTVLSGLKIGGFSVSVTDKGFHVRGGPPGSEEAPGGGDEPFPNQSPAEAVQQLLDNLNARLTLFRSVGRTAAGSADHFATGFVLSVDNPVGGVGPIPPGRFDVILASTSSQTLVSPQFTLGNLPSLGSSTPGVSAPEAPSVSIGRGGGEVTDAAGLQAAPSGSVAAIGEPDAAVGTLDVTPQRARYQFDGVPIGLVIGLLLVAAIVARYLRSLLVVLVGPKR